MTKFFKKRIKMNKNITAFTLIEMLIVIAIVGLLSGFLLYSLKPSTNKAKDTKIIALLNDLRAITNSYYDPLRGVYNLSEFNLDKDVIRITDEINKLGSHYNINVYSSPDTGQIQHIAFYVTLLDGDVYCVDTKGNESNRLPQEGDCFYTPRPGDNGVN